MDILNPGQIFSRQNAFLSPRRNPADLNYIIWPALITLYMFYQLISGSVLGIVYFPLGLMGIAWFLISYYTDNERLAGVINGRVRTTRDRLLTIGITTIFSVFIFIMIVATPATWMPLIEQCPTGSTLNLTTNLCMNGIASTQPTVAGFGNLTDLGYLMTFGLLTVELEALLFDTDMFPTAVNLFKNSALIAAFSFVAAVAFYFFLSAPYAAYVFLLAAGAFTFLKVINKEVSAHPAAVVGVSLLLIGSVVALYHVHEYSTFSDWMTLVVAAGAIFVGFQCFNLILESAFFSRLAHSMYNSTIICKMLGLFLGYAWLIYIVYIGMILLFDLVRNGRGVVVSGTRITDTPAGVYVQR